MVGPRSSTTWQPERFKDARGRPVSLTDPVKLHLLNQLMPGARRRSLLQVLSVALAFLVVVGGNSPDARRDWGLDSISLPTESWTPP